MTCDRDRFTWGRYECYDSCTARPALSAALALVAQHAATVHLITLVHAVTVQVEHERPPVGDLVVKAEIRERVARH